MVLGRNEETLKMIVKLVDELHGEPTARSKVRALSTLLPSDQPNLFSSPPSEAQCPAFPRATSILVRSTPAAT